MLTGKEAVERINGRFGLHAGVRTLHAKGTFCAGTFIPSPEGRALSIAPHMNADSVAVIARVSNGGGDPSVPDYAPDVRGLSVSFELPGGESRTDIVAQSMPRFPVRTPEAFLDFVLASEPSIAALWRMPLTLVRNPTAIMGMRHNAPRLKPPASYARLTYFAIHAFKWTDAEGESRWVRYRLEPAEREAFLSPKDAKVGGRDFLQEEITARLESGTARFDLVLQVAEPGDKVDDPTSVWGDDRKLLTAGTIELDRLIEDGDPFIFDPMKLCDGIEPSNDPILLFRPEAYGASFEQRL